MKIKKIMPPTWLLIAIVTMLALHFLFPVVWIIPPLWNLLGLFFIASGMIMNLIADKAFHQAGTTVKPFKESSSLVTNGVFQISRNPMYLGFVLILTGIAVLLRSLSPYLVVFAFAIFIDRIYVKTEELMLAEKFGISWEQYKSKIRRWL
jgi:protein-S-isoprenylcysteine O-methyltransferase Ste14